MLNSSNGFTVPFLVSIVSYSNICGAVQCLVRKHLCSGLLYAHSAPHITSSPLMCPALIAKVPFSNDPTWKIPIYFFCPTFIYTRRRTVPSQQHAVDCHVEQQVLCHTHSVGPQVRQELLQLSRQNIVLKTFINSLYSPLIRWINVILRVFFGSGNN